MRNPKMKKKMPVPPASDFIRANTFNISRSYTVYDGPNYNKYVPARDGKKTTQKRLLAKNDICRSGTTIVEGASHKLSMQLLNLYKQVFDIKTDLEARPKHKDTKLLLNSIENTLHIVKVFLMQTKDRPFNHISRKFIVSLEWIRMMSFDMDMIRVQEVSKPGVSPPDFQRTPRVREVQSCSRLGGLNQAPFMIDTPHLLLANNSYTYSPNEDEENIWQEFIEFDKETQVSEEKRSIEVEHPIVSIIGNYAISAFNSAFEQHVKNGEHNKLRHFEFLECKFSKFVTGYHFDMTIEAFEEGYIGTYRTEVIWNIDLCAITVCAFVLTDRKPFGTKALAVCYVSCIRPITNTVKKLYKKKEYRLECLRRHTDGPQRGTALVEINRIERLRDKAIEGLTQRLYQDINLFFPSDCYRPTKRDGCFYPAASSGMVRRARDTTTRGYDFYNPALFRVSSGSVVCREIERN
ncbi:hypothetical protein CTI12_AA270100 [Artemisia annua]|uniref:Uncharacterized protein n=1 Tax=Artemisia annua TaxID=35608 RepID=A0A2U1NG79_ARTAN|nr:hypothetical protein CTI12_AA270100 [Artemisia annua]